jgi:hypothetical protein
VLIQTGTLISKLPQQRNKTRQGFFVGILQTLNEQLDNVEIRAVGTGLFGGVMIAVPFKIGIVAFENDIALTTENFDCKHAGIIVRQGFENIVDAIAVWRENIG